MRDKTYLGKTDIPFMGKVTQNRVLSVSINPDILQCVFTKSLKTRNHVFLPRIAI